jgi:hypothetical protein
LSILSVSAGTQGRFLKFRGAEMAEFLENGKIDNQIADGDSSTRFALFWLKDSEGKILDGKMRVRCDFDERLEWHAEKEL